MYKTVLITLALTCNLLMQAQVSGVKSAQQINPTTVEVTFSNSQKMFVDFYGDNIFRLFSDPTGGSMRDPEARPAAQILVDNPRKPVSALSVKDDNGTVAITTGNTQVAFNKKTGLMSVYRVAGSTKNIVLSETEPALYETNKVTLTFQEQPDEYFYGGGVQNGRFSHKGKIIAIENQNSWTDGGVASPTPFYWSTKGYGMMWYTFKKGKYDFGAKEQGKVQLYHETGYLDLFVMVDETCVPLLNDFYQLTGNPVLLPKFGFYQGHLNAYNRDYWKEDTVGILFEDGKRYKESQSDNGGIKESLNGEKNNYQFSARAVIDRYKAYDMPFGWILPNDGYGAGYGQTETLDGNIQNLKELGDYARKNGVQIGLWTQSDLHPKPEISALLQRDIVKEVRDAGVRVLKTDVAWVGAGYSFGLNGIADVSQIMSQYGNNARPFIISLDGWAGTQRYATIWTGDQTGGQWEYIRFHIPTYLGSGLSGQPNITSDMDGIFGGKNPIVNTRDFQWKTFTPMQLNMDGWGSNEKYPQALGEPATSINRRYLKLKSALIPYTYSIAKEAVDGLPIIRAMLLVDPNAYTLGKATQYQFMYGPYFLVAPIYQATQADEQGNDIRNGIYLPEGEWFDYFTGEKYLGGRIINSFAAPLDKLPVFVKAGAIIPMTNPNNNVSEINTKLRIYDLYPAGNSSFVEYDDDGVSEAYKTGEGATTRISSSLNNKQLLITIAPTQGEFQGFEKIKATQVILHLTAQPKKITAKIGNKKYSLKPEYTRRDGQLVSVSLHLPETDITKNQIEISVNGFVLQPGDHTTAKTGALSAPSNAQVSPENTTAYTLQPTWQAVANADYYEIEFNSMRYSTIKDTHLLFDGLTPVSDYTFKLRAVNKDGHSDWTSFSAKTSVNPLEFAIPNIAGTSTARSQGSSSGIQKLFDYDESNLWHTAYNDTAVPFDIVIDLKTINQLDKLEYLPRDNAGNGTILKGAISYSYDRENWTLVDSFLWARNTDTKRFTFGKQPTARYLKMSVTQAVGNFGSGREIYVFKVPGTESYLPGDINNDKRIDRNDLTSYMNYTGLRAGDSDYEGYISNGDLNRNGLIDAYDISVVATQLDGGIGRQRIFRAPVNGKLTIAASKSSYNAGETVAITVKGVDLQSVNAFSFALPYNPQDYEYLGVDRLNLKDLENLTYDRLHSNGKKALYPTFVNIGDKPVLEASDDLLVIRFKAKRKVKFDLQPVDVILVDKQLNIKQ